GALLAWRRARRSGRADALAPGRLERAALVVAGGGGVGGGAPPPSPGGVVRRARREGPPPWGAGPGRGPGPPRGPRAPPPPAPSAVGAEGLMLAGLGAGCVLAGVGAGPPPAPEVAWVFEPVPRGVILSSPRVDGDRVYVSAAHVSGLKQFGAVYCLDRATGRE